ncbi:MAG: PQQ-binding-like beta-propeller repeat protein [Planctomycetes bacterium]|nr:PQQ-binding-like beta-propeller repeat protein [Planctomycetota bacterium]
MHQRMLGVIAAVLSLCVANATDARSAERNDVIPPESLEQAGYGKFWNVDLNLVGGDRVSRVYLLDENLYIKTRMGIVTAVQADTGLIRWSRSLDDHSFRDRAPTHVSTDHGDGPVVFVTHSKIHVFDRYGGDLIRQIELPLPAGGGAVADACNMYLGGSDGKFYALRWRCAGDRPLTRWRAAVNGVVASTPMLAHDDRIYFAATGGDVYCVATSNKALLWSYRTEGNISGGVHVDESGVYVASQDHRLYVLDRDDGSPIRSYLLPGPLLETPVVAQRTVYQYCQHEGLFAFDVDTRKTLWHKPEARKFVARAAESLVLMSETGDLSIVDNESGALRHTIDLPEDALVATNSRDATLFVLTPAGRLLCARPLGYPYLRRERMTAARARLHHGPRWRQADSPENHASSAHDPGSTDDDWTADPLRSGEPR